MKTNITMLRLGDYIQEVNERNSNREINLSQGICNLKYFQDPKQVSETPHLDKIVRKGQFAYNRATTRNGEKISIALREGPDCTVSSAYCVFYITNENVIDPHWLWLWFKRPEFDRYAIFKSHGSAHEFFEFETMCNVELPVPPIEEQRAIVERHKAIERKIETNRALIASLEDTARTIYRHMFVDDIDSENLPDGWHMGTLSEIGKIVGGATPSTEKKEYWVESGIRWLSPIDLSKRKLVFTTTSFSCITNEAYKSCSTKMLPKGTVLFSSRAPIGLLSVLDIEACTNQGFKSVIPNEDVSFPYIYFTLDSSKEKMNLENTGSTFAEVSGKYMNEFCVLIPSKEAIDIFNSITIPIFDYIKVLEKEIVSIKELL